MNTEAAPAASGTLFVVATPIGNLEDITLRAIRILKEADLIASEDTRHTGNLLRHLGITTPLTSYYREREQEKSAQLLEMLRQGRRIALVTDAGTPAIADPGAILVRRARDSGVPVVPVPGPSALAAALSIAGLDETRFYFAGFPPAREKGRRDFFRALADLDVPLVFYESPHRIARSLTDCAQILGDRQALLCRELTKIHEEQRQGRLSGLAASCQGHNRGEFVVIVAGAGPEDRRERPEDIEELLIWYRDRGDVSLKDAVRRIARELGCSRSQLYRRALEIWGKTEP